MLQDMAAGTPNLEFALIADGVPMDKVYPIDIDRAFKSLSRIKSAVPKFWDTGALSSQMLADKEADTRQLAAFVLGNINPNPQSVVAALKTAATKDESELVRRSAGEALKKIDPAAAAGAGIQ